MDKKRYKITFEFETDDFVDECDLEISMEHMFPDWKKINVEEIVPKCKENAPNQSQDRENRTKAIEPCLTTDISARSSDACLREDSPTPDNIHTQINKEIEKDYENS